MPFIATLISNVELSPGYWRMRLTASDDFLSAQPGQFVMVKIAEAIDPLLRRPFGIFDVATLQSAEGGTHAVFDLLYHVVGKGTAKMASLRADDRLDILGPLGTGFNQGTAAKEKLIVGGGIGLAPLYMLAREMVEKQFTLRVFIGGRSRKDILCVREFQELGIECIVATEDGSLGERGFVTAPLINALKNRARDAEIYTCGPPGMLNAVAKIADEHAVACQVSLEGMMACGVGACLGCVAPGHKHSASTPDFRCVCTEGPVFDARELQWETAEVAK